MIPNGVFSEGTVVQGFAGVRLRFPWKDLEPVRLSYNLEPLLDAIAAVPRQQGVVLWIECGLAAPGWLGDAFDVGLHFEGSTQKKREVKLQRPWANTFTKALMDLFFALGSALDGQTQRIVGVHAAWITTEGRHLELPLDEVGLGRAAWEEKLLGEGFAERPLLENWLRIASMARWALPQAGLILPTASLDRTIPLVSPDPQDASFLRKLYWNAMGNYPAEVMLELDGVGTSSPPADLVMFEKEGAHIAFGVDGKDEEDSYWSCRNAIANGASAIFVSEENSKAFGPMLARHIVP